MNRRAGVTASRVLGLLTTQPSTRSPGAGGQAAAPGLLWKNPFLLPLSNQRLFLSLENILKTPMRDCVSCWFLGLKQGALVLPGVGESPGHRGGRAALLKTPSTPGLQLHGQTPCTTRWRRRRRRCHQPPAEACCCGHCRQLRLPPRRVDPATGFVDSTAWTPWGVGVGNFGHGWFWLGGLWGVFF